MAKAIAGAALIAGAIALDVASAGAASPLTVVLFAGMTAADAVAPLAILGAALAMGSIADALTNTVTTPQTVRSPAAPWQVIYGNVRCGGSQIDLNSYGDNFKYCDMIIALACHPCVGVQQHTENVGSTVFPSYGGLYINGQGMQWRNSAEGGSGAPGSAGYDINGIPYGYTTSNDIQDLNQNHYSTGTHVYMEAYAGTGSSYQAGSGLVANQVSQFYITKGPTGHWDSTCTMMIDPTGAFSADGQPKGFTYVYLRLLYGSDLWAGGLPESLRFDVQGKSDIWDPRLSGGAGGYAYTNNAALVIADYMTNPYFGMGYKMSDFNTDALIAAANLCDVAVPLAAGGTIAQYTINGTFTTNENPGSILKNMLAACGGDMSLIGGEWFIFPGTYVYPTATIDSSMMLGPIQVKTGKRGRDLVNAVKGAFVCPAAIDTLGSPNIFYNEQPNVFNGQWQKQAFPPYAMDPQHGYSSDEWLAADGQKLYLELDLPFTTSAATCQRLAKQALLKNRIGNGLEDSLNKGLSFVVECNLRAYDIVPHDTVWVSYPRFNWTAPAAGFSVPTDTIPDYTYTEFEVTDTKLTIKEQDGQPPVPVYELTLRATSPDIYLWNASDELTMTDNKYPQFANTMQVAGPTGLTATSGSAHAVANPDGTSADGILAQWTPPADGYVLNGGELIVQIMPVVSPTQTYTSTPITGGGVSNLITLSGSSNPYVAGESIFLGGAGVGGVDWTGVALSKSGMTLSLVDAPPTAVTGGSILSAGWQTVAKLDGTTNQYLITGVVDGEQYYVQVYALNSAGRTSTPTITGPVIATNGTTTPGLLPYPILPHPIRVAVDVNGYVQNLGSSGGTTIVATGSGTMGLIDSSGNLIPNAVIPKQVVNTYPFAATNAATRSSGANDGDMVYFDQAAGPSGCLYVVDQNQGVLAPMDSAPLIMMQATNPPSGLGVFAATNITNTSFQVFSKSAGSSTTYPDVTLTKTSIAFNPSRSPTVLDTVNDAYNTNVNQTLAGSATIAVTVSIGLDITTTPAPYSAGRVEFEVQVWSGNMGTLLVSGAVLVSWSTRLDSASGSIILPVSIAEGTQFTVRVYATDADVPSGHVIDTYVDFCQLTVSAGGSSVNGVDFTSTIIEGW